MNSWQCRQTVMLIWILELSPLALNGTRIFLTFSAIVTIEPRISKSSFVVGHSPTHRVTVPLKLRLTVRKNSKLSYIFLFFPFDFWLSIYFFDIPFPFPQIEDKDHFFSPVGAYSVRINICFHTWKDLDRLLTAPVTNLTRKRPQTTTQVTDSNTHWGWHIQRIPATYNKLGWKTLNPDGCSCWNTGCAPRAIQRLRRQYSLLALTLLVSVY